MTINSKFNSIPLFPLNLPLPLFTLRSVIYFVISFIFHYLRSPLLPLLRPPFPLSPLLNLSLHLHSLHSLLLVISFISFLFKFAYIYFYTSSYSWPVHLNSHSFDSLFRYSSFFSFKSSSHSPSDPLYTLQIHLSPQNFLTLLTPPSFFLTSSIHSSSTPPLIIHVLLLFTIGSSLRTSNSSFSLNCSCLPSLASPHGPCSQSQPSQSFLVTPSMKTTQAKPISPTFSRPQPGLERCLPGTAPARARTKGGRG